VKIGDVLKSDGQPRDDDGRFTSTGAPTKADIESHKDMIHNLVARHTAMGSRNMTPEQHAEVNGHYRKLQEMMDAREDRSDKTVKAGDLLKAKDESGHEHSPENGQFVSSGGSKISIDESGHGSAKTKSGGNYDIRPREGGGHTLHSSERQVGEIKPIPDAARPNRASYQARSVAANGKKEFKGNFAHPHGAAAHLAETHEHESKGAQGKPETPREKIMREHTDPETRALDGDSAIADRKRQGFLPVSSTLKRKAIFMIGGGGVGKGGVVKESYTGNEGDTYHRDNGDGTATEETIAPGHEKYIAPKPGFEHAPIFDSDAEKARNPLYSHEKGEHPSGARGPEHAGKYGPSGPTSWAELQQYPEHERAALDEHIQRSTGFRDARDFANHVIKDPYEKGHPKEGQPRNEDGRGEDFGGGLTHEISSHVVKQRLQNALRDPNHGSFIYDSTGSANYKKWAQDAMDNGYDVEFNHADAPREVAHHRNADRKRTVPEPMLNGTHDKVASILPGLKQFAEEGHAKGLPIDFKHTPTYTDEDLAHARRLGFTEKGAPKGYVAPKNAKKAADATRAREPKDPMESWENPGRSKSDYRTPGTKTNPGVHREAFGNA
jgi:hypothetical protein